MSRVDNDRLVTISREKAEELLAELPPHLAAMARLTLETGLRRHNVTHLRWEQVDLERRLVWIPGEKTKNGKPLGMPLSATATQVLMQQNGNHREYVFIYQDGPVYQTSTRAFKAAAKRAGLPAGFRWHDLSHIWASWLA